MLPVTGASSGLQVTMCTFILACTGNLNAGRASKVCACHPNSAPTCGRCWSCRVGLVRAGVQAGADCVSQSTRVWLELD
jgi:hypothetical protein